MKFLKLWRTFKEGWKNFCRNGWLSLATVSVLVLSLFVMSVTVMLGIAANYFLGNIQDRVNVSVYFNPNVSEQQILNTKDQLESYTKEIRSIEYISQDQALAQLLDTEKNNPDIQSALDEIGFNPLMASLVIKANDPSQYAVITETLEKSQYGTIINHINYDRNREAIEKLNSILNIVQKIGLTLGVIFLFISALITYNTIRLTLFSHKREFEIMRLVGASNIYIKMPSIFEGVFYGFFAGLVTLGLLVLTLYFVAPLTRGAITSGDVIGLYLPYWWIFVLAVLLIGMFLGVFSSWIAIKKYLKV